MPPPHVATFRRFAEEIPNHLEASIAFGLFMEAERIWADHERDPSDTKYRNYQRALTNHDIAGYAKDARELLADFGNNAVATKRAEILQQALAQYEAAATEGHGKFRRSGVWEAFWGAFVYSVALILASFVLKYYGIDLIEVYKRVAGH